MLTSAILDFFYAIASWLTTNVLPNADLSPLAPVSDAISHASSYLSSVNAFVPVYTLVAILGLMLIFEGVQILIRIINWIIRKIPTIS
jgi:hypothetical protein